MYILGQDVQDAVVAAMTIQDDRLGEA